MLKRMGLWAALCAAVVLPAVGFGQALANRVPGDALVYVGWAGTDTLQAAGGGYEGSHLKAVMTGSALPEFLDKKLPALLEKLSDEERAAGVALQVEQVLAVMGKYPTAIYVGPVDLPKGAPPVPHIALLCDAGAGADALEAKLKPMVQMAGGMVQLQRVNGATVVFMGGMTPTLEGIFGGKSEPAALTGQKDFAAAIAHVQKGAALTFYANAPALVKLGDDASAMDPDAQQHWPPIRDALNLKALTQTAFTCGFDGNDWMTQGFVGSTGTDRGLTMLLGGKPLAKESLKVVPADATWMAAGTMDLAAVFAEVKNVAGKVSPDGDEQMKEGLSNVNEAAGVDVEKDVIDTLGSEWVGYSSPSIGGSGLMGMVMVNTLKDAPRLEKAIGTLEAKATEALAQQQNGRPGFMGPEIGIHHASMSGLDVHYIPLFIVSPAWCVHGGKLFIATTPQTIPTAVEQADSKGKSILDSEKFTGVLKRLGGEIGQVSSLQYVDLPRTAPDSYQFLGQIMAVAETLGGEDVPPTLLPGLSKLLPELAPSGGISWTDASGWHCKSVSPLPGSFLLTGQQMGMMGTATPALMAAVMLPSLGHARALSGRAADAANVSGIAKGCVVYANDFNDKMPEHLAELVARNQITPRSLVVKGSGTLPLELTAEQREKMEGDWHIIQKDIDAHCDYVYLGKGTKNTTDSSQVLVFTKPELKVSREGINLGFYDAHAEWQRFPIGEEVFTATNTMRKELGLPLIELKNGRPVLEKTAAK